MNTLAAASLLTLAFGIGVRIGTRSLAEQSECGPWTVGRR
jgi:hypothetical protein